MSYNYNKKWLGWTQTLGLLNTVKNERRTMSSSEIYLILFNIY